MAAAPPRHGRRIQRINKCSFRIDRSKVASLADPTNAQPAPVTIASLRRFRDALIWPMRGRVRSGVTSPPAMPAQGRSVRRRGHSGPAWSAPARPERIVLMQTTGRLWVRAKRSRRLSASHRIRIRDPLGRADDGRRSDGLAVGVHGEPAQRDDRVDPGELPVHPNRTRLIRPIWTSRTPISSPRDLGARRILCWLLHSTTGLVPRIGADRVQVVMQERHEPPLATATQPKGNQHAACHRTCPLSPRSRADHAPRSR